MDTHIAAVRRKALRVDEMPNRRRAAIAVIAI
jgi:hypothetical protein